jgi:hypothetical protein
MNLKDVKPKYLSRNRSGGGGNVRSVSSSSSSSSSCSTSNSSSKGKGKEIPLHNLTDPEGFRSLRLPDFKTIGT